VTRPLRVLYSLPDGAQSSTLVRTALFDSLTTADDVEWLFVTPLAAEGEFVHGLGRPGVRWLPWPALRLGALDRHIQFLRQELWKVRVRTATSDIFARRMAWVEPKRYWFHHRAARLLHRFPSVDRLLAAAEAAAVGDGDWGRLIEEHRPAAVVLGSGGTKLQELPLARAAVRRGLPVYGVIPSWDNLTSKGPLLFRSRRLAVWCELMRREAAEYYGYRPDEVDVTGPPPFDPHARRPTAAERDRFFAALGLDPRRRLITYTSVPAAVCPASANYVPLLADLVASGRLGRPCQLLVRLHPQDNFAAFDRLPPMEHVRIERPGRYRGAAAGNAAILHYDPTAQDVRHLTETLSFSDVVVNVASTITLEACAVDRPVVNLAFNPPGAAWDFDPADYYRLVHYRPVADSGAVAIARSPEELTAALAEALDDPGRRSARRRELYRLYDPFGDGRAAERIGACLLRFVRECRTDSQEGRHALRRAG
jgi:hypothetical protein